MAYSGHFAKNHFYLFFCFTSEGDCLSARMNKRLFNFINILLLIAVASFYALWDINKGELIGADTCAHALTGIFFSDFFKDVVFLKSFKDIWNYIWIYYAHYPALGLLHWPPLFHLIEGFYFLFVNISESHARFLIYIFFVLAVIYYYLLMLKLFDYYVAILSSVLFITSPIIIIYSNIVSLEIPSLALSLMAIYFFNNFRHDFRTKDGLLTSIATGLALLTKQTALFLLLFFILFFLFNYNKYKLNIKLYYKKLIIFFVLIVILIFPYYFIAMYFHSGTIFKDVLIGSVSKSPYLSIHFYLYYIIHLDQQLSYITILLLLIYSTIIFTFYNKLVYSPNFLIIWALSCYLFFTFIAQKDVRYIIYWIPALTGVASIGFFEVNKYISNRYNINSLKYALIFIVSIICISISSGFLVERPFIEGYDNVAKYIVSRVQDRQNEIILYDGYDYGNMIISLRKNDPRRKIYLFRTSKYLYTTNIMPQYETRIISSEKYNIIMFLKKYGIRYITLSCNYDNTIISSENLRKMIKEDRDFILLKQFYVNNNDGRDGYVSVYYYKEGIPLASGTELEIPMLTIGKTIRIQLK